MRAQQLKIVYSFTPGLSLQSLVQYDTVTRAVATNTLLGLDHPAEPHPPRGVESRPDLDPESLQGQQKLTGTTVLVKLDRGFYQRSRARCRSPRLTSRRTCSADPADAPRSECGRYRGGLPDFAGNHWRTAGPRQSPHQGGRHPLPIPDREELPGRLDAVLEAIYAAYAKAWGEIGEAASAALAGDAVWLARLIAHLLPDEPGATGRRADTCSPLLDARPKRARR